MVSFAHRAYHNNWSMHRKAVISLISIHICIETPTNYRTKAVISLISIHICIETPTNYRTQNTLLRIWGSSYDNHRGPHAYGSRLAWQLHITCGPASGLGRLYCGSSYLVWGSGIYLYYTCVIFLVFEIKCTISSLSCGLSLRVLSRSIPIGFA